MAWFKKSDDGDNDMMNSASGSRPAAHEPTRPEPREPRMEPRETRVEPRAPVPPRATEPRAPEVRPSETRAVESAPRASVLTEQRVVAWLEHRRHWPPWLRHAGAAFFGAVVCPVLDFFARDSASGVSDRG